MFLYQCDKCERNTCTKKAMDIHKSEKHRQGPFNHPLLAKGGLMPFPFFPLQGPGGLQVLPGLQAATNPTSNSLVENMQAQAQAQSALAIDFLTNLTKQRLQDSSPASRKLAAAPAPPADMVQQLGGNN